jgi:predicted nucleic acid-binding protein
MAHKLMTLEAANAFGWSSKVVNRLRRDPNAVMQLDTFQQAVEKVPQLGIDVLTIPPSLIETATRISKQSGLLCNDALLVAVMQANGLTHLASNDGDFDRVPGVTRYGPV